MAERGWGPHEPGPQMCGGTPCRAAVSSDAWRPRVREGADGWMGLWLSGEGSAREGLGVEVSPGTAQGRSWQPGGPCREEGGRSCRGRGAVAGGEGVAEIAEEPPRAASRGRGRVACPPAPRLPVPAGDHGAEWSRPSPEAPRSGYFRSQRLWSTVGRAAEPDPDLGLAAFSLAGGTSGSAAHCLSLCDLKLHCFYVRFFLLAPVLASLGIPIVRMMALLIFIP